MIMARDREGPSKASKILFIPWIHIDNEAKILIKAVQSLSKIYSQLQCADVKFHPAM